MLSAAVDTRDRRGIGRRACRAAARGDRRRRGLARAKPVRGVWRTGHGHRRGGGGGDTGAGDWRRRSITCMPTPRCVIWTSCGEAGWIVTTPLQARARADVLLLVGPGLPDAWPDLDRGLGIDIAPPLPGPCQAGDSSRRGRRAHRRRRSAPSRHSFPSCSACSARSWRGARSGRMRPAARRCGTVRRCWRPPGSVSRSGRRLRSIRWRSRCCAG